LCKAVVILDTALERELVQIFVKLGASGYTAIERKGLALRHSKKNNTTARNTAEPINIAVVKLIA
jgi:hypothetical protein